MLSQSGHFRNLLIGKAKLQKIFCVGKQFLGNIVMVCLERDCLHDCFPTLWADKAMLVQHNKAYPAAKA